jgi:competence protein ComEC
MTVLYLTLAYLIGIACGRMAWEYGWLDCTWPTWLWWLPLALLFCTPVLHRLPAFGPKTVALRWPQAAGFVVPRTTPPLAFWLAAALCILMGLLRYASYPLEPCLGAQDLAYYNLPADQAFEQSAPLTTITGWVSSYPLVADTKQRMAVTAQTIERDGVSYPVQGVLRLTTSIRQRYRYGQPVRLVGRLVTPPVFEDFSYREYLAREGIHSLLYGARIEELPGPNQGDWLLQGLYGLRARGEAAVNRLLPEPYAGLANGMVLGIESGIPDELYDQFNLTGSSHVIVISGSNVALIVGVIMGVTQRLLGRRRVLWPTLAGIGCYALLVGGEAAVLRAALMGALVVVATVLDRRSTALVSLACACWVMTLLNPLTLWDVGFQLSSAATAGLILFTPGLEALFNRLWGEGASTPAAGMDELLKITTGFIRSLFAESLVTTLAANATTLPLVVYYFQRLSVVSLATNLAIIPVQPLIMLSGSAGVVLGMAGAEWPAQWTLWLTWLGLVWTVGVVQWTASLPGASLTIAGFGLGSLLITYGVVFGLRAWPTFIEWAAQRTRLDLRTWSARLVGPGAITGAGVCALLVWSGVRGLPDGRLHLYFLDIGQGDAIFIQTPSGRQVLIDGGMSPELLFNELGAVMPFWDRTIDMIALTHPDLDHMEAQVQVPNRFTVTTAVQTFATGADPDAERWRANLTASGAAIQMQQQGSWIDLGDGVALWVLWPPPVIFGQDQGADKSFINNENSLVIKLTYGEFSALLTGDIGLPVESTLLDGDTVLNATVLKVGHHGSRVSTSVPFVQAVNPQLAVIQSGAENTYGHPHQEVLDNLAGRTILRNDLHGRIHLYSDGQQLWIETEQQSSR